MRVCHLGLAGQGRRRKNLRGMLVILALTCCASASPSGDILAVSKPAASLLPTDPPQGVVYRVRPDLSSANVFFKAEGGPVSLVYIVLDSRGNGYLTFDDGPVEDAPGGVMIVEDFLARGGVGFDAARDRLITGTQVGLAEPKDLVLVEDPGVLIVADFANATIKVFDTRSAGDVAPLFATNELGPSPGNGQRRPWGLAYDEVSDRLFVGATDGALLVYDAFLASQGRNGPSRVVTPTWQGDTISHNLHELIYNRVTDRILVTDVGAATTSDQAGYSSDGALLMLEGASTASGLVPVALRLAGPASLLGNPVSLVQQGDSLFVAENGLDLILRFEGLLGQRGAIEASPDAVISLTKPESLILLPRKPRFGTH